MVDSEHTAFQQNTIFWDILEQYVVAVPEYVKNLLTLTGFDNVTAIQSIDDEDLTEIESFARLQLTALMKVKNPENLYFIYVNKPNQFRFVPGHKKLIFGLRTVVKNHADEITSRMQRRLIPNIEQPHVITAPLPVITMPVSLAPPPIQGLPPPKRKVSSTSDENERRLLEIINTYIERAQVAINDGCDYTIKRVTILANPNEEPVSAGVFCTICKNVIKIGTQSNLNGRRWIISNYVRHFRRHFPNFPLVNLSGNLSGMSVQSDQDAMDEAKHSQDEFEIFCNNDETNGSAIKRERRDGDYLSHLEEDATGQ